jgi:iron complex outermembrane receptor protein
MISRRFLFAILACTGIQSAIAQQSSPTIPPVNTTIVVLGSADPVNQDDSARAVVVMNPQEHPLAFQDAEDYLRTDSSVDIEQRGAAGVQADLSIRGTSFEQTLVLLNGLRINDVETSHFNLDVPVPLDALGSINVLHGAGSTLYGSDALGGVVDFLTLKPLADSLRLRAGVGSFGENQQTFTATALGGRWSEVLAGARDFSTGFIEDRDYRTTDVSLESRLDSLLGETDILLAGSDRPFGANDFYGAYNSWERTKGWFAALSQQFNPETQFALAYRRHSDIFVLLRNAPSVYKNQHIDENWEAALRRSQPLFAARWKNAVKIHYGLEEDTDQIQSNNLGQHGRNRGAGYVDVDLSAAKRGSLSVGLREEVLSGGRLVLSPQFAGGLWLRPDVKLRGSIGYGFRLPTYTDLYYSCIGCGPTTLGNANLKPESAWNYEGGADWYPNARTTASLTAFDSEQTNTIDYVWNAAGGLWQASNLSGMHIAGVESALAFVPAAGEQVRLSWTWLTGPQNAFQGLLTKYSANYPVNNASAEWSVVGRHGWSEAWRMKTRVEVTERYAKDAYPVWDLSLVRERGRIHPFVQATNLSNTGYDEINPVNIPNGGTLPGVPMPGRGFVGGVELLLQHAR